MANDQYNRSNQQHPSGSGRPGRKGPLPTYRRRPLNWLLIVLAIAAAMMLFSRWHQVQELKYNEFREHLKAGHIKSVEIKGTKIVGQFTEQYIRQHGPKGGGMFKVGIEPEVVGQGLATDLQDSGVEWEMSEPELWFVLVINWVLPILVFGLFFYLLFLRNIRGGAGGMLMSFGRSRHRVRGKDQAKVTFDHVAGVDEAKEEVSEIIEFLKNPKKFQRLGGRIPRGVLLVGPPGCGKTLLAKAIAGEADVPFFSISGSDFVEMFVGVGASRVRDLFKQAKENSPCIIFLDEIDAIGRKRGPGFVSGGHDEREQTLNAILVEMDGFDTNDQVIMIAATNRGDILDSALMRPGRFDRQIFVPLPDIKGRVEILNVHAKSVKLGPNVDLHRLARGTPMFSGADLAAIINEAAIAATMTNKDYVEMEDLEEARDKVRWGRAKRSRVVDAKEKTITAYHEAGHTLVQSLLEDADPLHKVSIIPRGPMGGATFALPEKDRTIFTKRYCMALLQVAFGGRIAEEKFCDDISSGAQTDIQQATEIARRMVLTWGMSEELGPVSYEPEGVLRDVMLALPFEREYSEKTAELIDKEVRRLLDEAYKKTEALIEANRDMVEKIAEALLKYETLDASDVERILQGVQLDKLTVSELLAAEQVRGEQKQPGQQKPEQ
jgi:cell division protease FtsH